MDARKLKFNQDELSTLSQCSIGVSLYNESAEDALEKLRDAKEDYKYKIKKMKELIKNIKQQIKKF